MEKNDEAFKFSPGGLGKFLAEFAKRNGLMKGKKPNLQEATRQIVRERMVAEQEASRSGC